MRAATNQKILIKEFSDKFAQLQEKYYVPEDNDSYWDNLTSDSMELVASFNTNDEAQNSLISDMVMLFMKSREAML